jgi:hypothetical protein
MAKKPSLADLTAKKSTAAAPPPDQAPETTARAGSQPDGRKGVLVRLRPEGWRELRDLAAELTLSTGVQVSMQSLIVDAINGALKDNNRPPVA